MLKTIKLDNEVYYSIQASLLLYMYENVVHVFTMTKSLAALQIQEKN